MHKVLFCIEFLLKIACKRKKLLFADSAAIIKLPYLANSPDSVNFGRCDKTWTSRSMKHRQYNWPTEWPKTCSLEVGCRTLVRTLSNINRFKKFFPHWKKITIIPTKPLQYIDPHLKHVATLPYKTQDAKLSHIVQESCCDIFITTLGILSRFSIFFTVVKRTCFFKFPFRLNSLRWQQTTFVAINEVAKSLKTCHKRKWFPWRG